MKGADQRDSLDDLPPPPLFSPIDQDILELLTPSVPELTPSVPELIPSVPELANEVCHYGLVSQLLLSFRRNPC